ncbi:MAG: hypothetical protein J6A25_12335 [Lachnospiraceae bacterium]|nr:hypothetical protein [Lachnospiraceae bacterium]
MKRPLLESEKNYLKCAVLIILVGCGLWAMGKQTEAIICIVLGVLFAASAIAMYLTSDHEAAKKVIEKSKSNKPTKEEKKKDKIESKEEVKEADIEKSEEDKEE